jgi:thiamine biosynthesis lipoprotein
MRAPAPPGSIAGLPFLGPGLSHVAVSGGWAPVGIGTDVAAVAERDALGTNVRVAVWPAHHLAAALGAVDAELDRLDRTASRFRSDSEISRIHQAGGGSHQVSPGLAETVGVALAAARWTGGLVDPTVGAAVIRLGYDRDFAAICAESGATEPPPPPPVRSRDSGGPRPAPIPGWESVRLGGTRLMVPSGVCLDLGATAKGLGSDRAAATAWRAAGGGGVLVSLGGDIAVAGEPPGGGWPIMVADSSGAPASTGARTRAGAGGARQLVRLVAGAVATSSVTTRQWQQHGRPVHHIVDPRTGRPARGPWRTVSVAASSCALANAAATAAIVAGGRAEAWLSARGLPARLVTHDDTVYRLNGWPAAEGGVLPASRRLADLIGARSGTIGTENHPEAGSAGQENHRA